MSTVTAHRQALQGYVTATQRPACCNCTHREPVFVDRMPPYDPAEWRCRLGSFVVNARAICDKHSPLTREPGR